jgi:peptidylprolyl isomerase
MRAMRIRLLILCGLAALALTLASCGGGDTETAEFTVEAPPADAAADQADAAAAAERKDKPEVTLPDSPPKELETRDIKVGTGPAVKKGDTALLDYVGVGVKTKKEFDSSFASGREPIPVALGQGQVIAGWDEGIVGMKVGGRRELVIPADKAYGAAGRPPSIKPNEALVFVVDLVEIQ